MKRFALLTIIFTISMLVLSAFIGKDEKAPYIIVDMQQLDSNLLNKTIDPKWENLWVSSDCKALMIAKPGCEEELSSFLVEADYVKEELPGLPQWKNSKQYYECYNYDTYDFSIAYSKARHRGLPLFLWQNNLYTTE